MDLESFGLIMESFISQMVSTIFPIFLTLISIFLSFVEPFDKGDLSEKAAAVKVYGLDLLLSKKKV